MRARPFSAPRSLIPFVFLIMLSSIALSACSNSGPSPAATQAQTTTATQAAASPTAAGLPVGATVELGSIAFVQTTVTLSAGKSLQFVDPSATGGTHILCLGTNGQCDAAAQGPDSLLAPGLSLHPGDTKEIAFPSGGTFDVTCTIHPSIHLTITVLGGE
jgi:plastocyanin